MANYQDQYNQLKAKVESKGMDNTIDFYDEIIIFKKENLYISVNFRTMTVESYVEVHYMSYGDSVTHFDTLESLYRILYRDYKRYFSTCDAASKAIVWIKQMFLMNK